MVGLSSLENVFNVMFMRWEKRSVGFCIFLFLFKKISLFIFFNLDKANFLILSFLIKHMRVTTLFRQKVPNNT